MTEEQYTELKQLLDLDEAIAYAKQQIQELQYTLEHHPRSSATLRRISQWEVVLHALYDEAHTMLGFTAYSIHYDKTTMPNLPRVEV